ncbi:hypothetical protein [Oleisolibacter albus]|uniref:hypothetical protein n=1 Tax=Oleisolibacter albus TaxID=2171757 RepID=UPI0012D83275|nr:hypothetical protein [Oleisolibacter albus]
MMHTQVETPVAAPSTPSPTRIELAYAEEWHLIIQQVRAARLKHEAESGGQPPESSSS